MLIFYLQAHVDSNARGCGFTVEDGSASNSCATWETQSPWALISSCIKQGGPSYVPQKVVARLNALVSKVLTALPGTEQTPMNISHRHYYCSQNQVQYQIFDEL